MQRPAEPADQYSSKSLLDECGLADCRTAYDRMQRCLRYLLGFYSQDAAMLQRVPPSGEDKRCYTKAVWLLSQPAELCGTAGNLDCLGTHWSNEIPQTPLNTRFRTLWATACDTDTIAFCPPPLTAGCSLKPVLI